CGWPLLKLAAEFFVKPDVPNSAARWPYLRGLAAATDKYEERPHDAQNPNRDPAAISRTFHNFPHVEISVRGADGRAASPGQ
ncbi:MAG TPA: hypothetical protein VFG88_05170, partial [Nocardioidaceae bacterium]|nr:hypothetical protein [Nocardioidaceae bacterium]